ncbi:MAG: hypothetical protein JNL83_04385 [Myxococcales bacterium]|nr:hypothetical protein [Myxococcales bacterium]
MAAGGCGRVAFDPAITPGDGGSDTSDGSDGPPPVPRCGPGETAGPFTTDFENGVPMFGSIYEIAPARMDVFAGQLRGRPAMAPGSNTYAGFEATVGDYRSRRAFVEIPTMVNTSGCAQVAIVIQDDDVVRYAELAQSCNLVEAMTWAGTTQTVHGSAPYDAALHRWWQLRSEAGTLSFELSPDGVSWTTLAAIPTPAYFDDAYLELSAGTYMLETQPIGEARFDNLYDCTR